MSDVINDEEAKEGVPPVTIDDAASNGNGNTGNSNMSIGQYDFETQVLVPCFKCDDDCWSRGWLLLPDVEDEGEGAERKNICDNCLLFHGKKVKGSERRFDGKIKIPVPKKKPKKKPPKKDVVAIKAKKTMTK